MGPDIIIPVVVLAIIVPIGILWAKKSFKDGAQRGIDDDTGFVAPSDRLTSNALRDLESPPWRVVYEIAHDKLSGITHVLIGPAGVYAVTTSMDPLPEPIAEPTPAEIGQAAIARGGVDDALGRCGMSSDHLLVVHWGVTDGGPSSVDVMHGVIAVDGRQITNWAAELQNDHLTTAQVDLAWSTVLTSIGRPDPLA
ncbi:MAG: hypothetical protein HKN41_09160 [Ilumatobacter sp.]|nr:hypothetical protein [Ilumatobacter sp.]